jgi:hypothetical protein
LKDHHLIKLLQQLDRKEMTRFREFVDSPYHNKHEGVRALVHHLNQIYPSFKERELERHTLFARLFPDEPHDQNRLAVLFTYTYRLFESWLIIEQLQQTSAQGERLLLQGLRSKGAQGQYEKRLRKAERQLKQVPFRHSQFHLLQYDLAAEADRYYSQQGEHRRDDSIQVKQDHLDLFYLSEKLKDACEMLVRSRILQVHYAPSMLEGVLEEVRLHWDRYQSYPAVTVYYHLYQLLTGTGNTLEVTLQVLETESQALPTEEQQLIYNYLQNYCIEQINQGRTEFLRTAFEVYQLQLSKQLIFVQDQLPEWHYKNIITIGLRLGEHTWVESFLHTYKAYLAPQVAENAFTFNLANFYYATGRLPEVLEHLSKVSYNDIRYNLGAKALLLRTYYDLDEFEAFLSHADAFQKYLHRNRLLNDQRIAAFRNLLQFARRAMILKNRLEYQGATRSRRELAQLTSRIQKTEPIINRGWLVEKVTDLRHLINGEESTADESVL